MGKCKDIIMISAVLCYSVLVIIWSKDIGKYVLNSINSCVNVIIPSLFIFMIISSFIITSNLYVLIGRPFSFIARYVFRIPEELFSVFLISCVGGYPVGAKLLSDLWREKRLDVNTYNDMMTYCYLSGPAFICSIVGVNIFDDIRVGIIIFISVLTANLIIAAIIGRKRTVPDKNKYNLKLNFSMVNLIKSISDGGKSMFSICVIIVFFSSVICIAEKIGAISLISNLMDKYTYLNYSDSMAAVKSIIEISNVSGFKADISLLPLIAALISFGGICVVIQIKGIVNVLPLKKFVVFRIVSMILSYLICKIICIAVFGNAVMTNSPAQLAHSQNSPIQTLFLLIMTILFLLKFSIEKKRKM